MIFRFSIFLGLVLLLGACASNEYFSTPYAAGYYRSEPISCVPYAREVSNFNIRGDAHTWWHQAEPRYSKGNTPRDGSVLVLARTNKLSRGHVAVVDRVIDSRHIDVTHSNWGSDRKSRSVVYERMRVEDVSPSNNWTLLRFWNYKAESFGAPYPAYGFIYK